MWSPRPGAAVTAAAAAALLLTGCADFGDPTAQTTRRRSTSTMLELGDETRTASGNVVRLLDYEFPVDTDGSGGRAAAAKIEACAGATASEETGASPAFFRLEMRDRSGRTASRPLREPALTATRIPRGECVEGWVTFSLEDGDEPSFFVFRGSSVVKWRLPA